MQGSNVPLFIITTSHDISTSTLRGHMPEWLIKREKECMQEVRYKPKMRRKKRSQESECADDQWPSEQEARSLFPQWVLGSHECILKTLHLFDGSDDDEEIVSLWVSVT